MLRTAFYTVVFLILLGLIFLISMSATTYALEQQEEQPPRLPTLAAYHPSTTSTAPPSLTPTLVLTLTPSLTFTYTPSPTQTYTPSLSPTASHTFPPSETPLPTNTPAPTLTHLESLETQLRQAPLLSEIGQGARDIFARGQALGNQAHSFAKIGDCNTESTTFLMPLDTGQYDLGDYSALQSTVDYFEGSFGRVSVAGKVGFNAASVQDSMLRDPYACYANESPLACEYRHTQPSLAIIMFGANDMVNLTPEKYETYLRQIIEFSSTKGIVPVLTTFTWRPDEHWEKVLEMNVIILNLGAEYGIPVINFWRAAQSLPTYGILPDNAHLNPGRPEMVFRGDEKQWGHTLRSLLTLQMLDKLRRELLAE